MSYYSAVVKCPYYEHDNIKESTITCESVLPGSTIKHHFSGKQALARCAGRVRAIRASKIRRLEERIREARV